MFDSLNKFFFNPRHLSNGIYYIQYPIPKRRNEHRGTPPPWNCFNDFPVATNFTLDVTTHQNFFGGNFAMNIGLTANHQRDEDLRHVLPNNPLAGGDSRHPRLRE